MSSKWIILMNVGIIILTMILVSRTAAVSLSFQLPPNLDVLDENESLTIVATAEYGWPPISSGISMDWTFTAENFSAYPELSGLQPSTLYSVAIYKEDQLVFEHPYDTDPDPPQNLTVECINSTTSEVLWETPQEGQVSGYRVWLVANETADTVAFETETSEQQMILHDLVPNRSYTVKVVSRYAGLQSASSKASFVQGTSDYGNCTEEPGTNATGTVDVIGNQTDFPITVIVAVVLGAVLGLVVFLGLAYFLVRVGAKAVDQFLQSRQRVRVGQYFEMATFNNRPNAAVPE